MSAQPASPPAPFDEVITVSSRIDQPRRELGTAVSVLSGEELIERGYASIIDALRTQPSIGVSNAGGLGKLSALRVRGEEGYRTQVRIDGIDVADPSATQVTPSVEHLLATRDIDRIEVLRGPQGFIYGSDSGGVINISSRRGESTLTGDVGVELGPDGFERVDAGVSGGSQRADFLLYASDIET
ncbi:MAG: TonB-dependent receptor plug domain-containing protein, partial [Gammaproteobacteria bacterium]|nr:TonB-dependent receptor plug domain-containing protein [Gammaproteobacteria bacterium]